MIHLNIYDGDFIAKIVSSYAYSQKRPIINARLGSKYDTAFTWRLFKRLISLKYFTLKDSWLYFARVSGILSARMLFVDRQ